MPRTEASKSNLDLDPTIFEECLDGKAKMYRCVLCGGRLFQKPNRHARLSRHQENLKCHHDSLVRSVNSGVVVEAEPSSSPASSRTTDPSVTENVQNIQQSDIEAWVPGGNYPPPSNADSTNECDQLNLDLSFIDQDEYFSHIPLGSPRSEFSSSTISEESDTGGWDGLLADDICPDVLPTEPVDQVKRRKAKSRVERGPWWPFRAKEYLISSLVIGHIRTIISRPMFNHVRMMFGLCLVCLPDWTTIRRGKYQLQKMLGVEVVASRSVLNTPLHYLSLKQSLAMEIANPWVAPHLQFYPEATEFKGVTRLSQSAKWLMELQPENRAQMVRQDQKDYYIYELVQLMSDRIVVPVYFYEEGGEMYAKCITPEIIVDAELGQLKFRIAKDLPFLSPALESIPTNQFYVEYPRMVYEDTLMSEICGDRLYEVDSGSTSFRQMPNKWREKAGGRIIRQMPISLYSDDTSGNTSKKWNKHISYYFTLASLPPHLTNQHFHCHFLCTSNSAGPMELAEAIVDDLIELQTEGVVAYDSSISEEVLVTSFLLCFLADTPMHAEITSTVMPANARSQCRSCDLAVGTISQRKTLAYLQFFLQISHDGVWIKNGARSWKGIKDNCYSVWEESKKPRSKTRVGELSTDLGIKDSINKAIYTYRYDILAKKGDATEANRTYLSRIELLDSSGPERLFNPFFRVADFNGCSDTPVEVLHVFLLGVVKYMVRDVMGRVKPQHLGLIEGRYRAFSTSSLNIPSLSPYYMAKHSSNLVGKEFKVVLQCAPFVLFGFMEEGERLAWMALCQLAPLVFQTCINNMDRYLEDLQFHIHKFLYYSFKNTAQWVNKPKFHMLLHLAESIRRFGPASLFATEKFESYNAVLRNVSVHSNRQSPGKDIAIMFANYKVMRHLTCGGLFPDPVDQARYTTANPAVSTLFGENVMIQKSMDFNSQTTGHGESAASAFPRAIKVKLAAKDKVEVPASLQAHLSGKKLYQVPGVQLDAHRVLKKGQFMLVGRRDDSGNISAGCIEHIWEARRRSQITYWVCYTEFDKAGIDDFYQMRMITRTSVKKFVHIGEVLASMNVQHNCHLGGCPVTYTGIVRIEREESEENNATVSHRDSLNFVVNSAELPGSAMLRQWAAVPRGENNDLIHMLHEGLARWHEGGGANAPGPISAIDPDLE
ncbi:hypothetical protein PGT21_007921 [Puccinia graminis f. sp. tritici]|nr:hypothetical protein PGT21_007921 [Puccinia graminis f. sp. tritici]KAA1135501.1 hypothetical protein PGTUg99_007913 [Puccinia graminis f. sp. tritici]